MNVAEQGWDRDVPLLEEIIMTMNLESVQAVIAANRAIQMEARKWNVRAGEQVFPVMTSDEWKSWLGSRLNGATSCATVPNLDSLRLPALPADMMGLVREMNPDSITLFGKEIPVEYREPYYGTAKLPQVTLGDEFISTNRWSGLPDEGVKLPGGRLVNVALKSASSYYLLAEGSDIPVLKQTMKNRLNEEQWSRFTDRPTIVVPTTIDDTTVMPEILTAVYGKCAVTGEDLVAFGTLSASRYWSSDPITWKPEWFRSRSEAETAFSKAQAELEKSKVEGREKREREAVQKAAEASKEKARALYGEMPYDNTGDLRDRLYNRAYAYLPSTNAEMRQWTIETEVVNAEAEVVTAELKRKKEEAGASLRKLARPILRSGETESESTVYGVPCNENGPCEQQLATEWRLYSHRDGELLRHKGYRSSSYGSTFIELIRDYMRGESDLAEVLRGLPAEVQQKSELDPILEVVQDVEMARTAKQFAEAAMQCCGGKVDRTLRILENESTAPYGRARRQDAIRRNLSGIENIEVGQRFLGYSRASDVDAILAGAVAWLQTQGTGSVLVTKVQVSQQATVPVVGSSLDALASKWGARRT